jgi:hypothetical protein
VIGRTIEIRITLKASVKPTMINCSLHRANAERKGWGLLAAREPSRPAAGGGTYSFVFTVPEREDTAFVFGLVYLSPTGRWEDGTRAATTKYVPYVRDEPAAELAALRKTTTYWYPTAAEEQKEREKAKTARPPGRPSLWVHPVLGLLLIAAAALATLKARRSVADRPGADVERAVWLAFAVLLLGCAAAELSGLGGHLAAWARRLAEARKVYELRRPFQQTIMAAMAAGGLGFLFLFMRAVRRPGSHRSIWWAAIGLGLYLAMSLASVLSFHAVDAARKLLWHGISPVDAVRGAGAAVTLAATALSLRPGRPRPVT